MRLNILLVSSILPLLFICGSKEVENNLEKDIALDNENNNIGEFEPSSNLQ